MVCSPPETGLLPYCPQTRGYASENSAIDRRGAASRSWSMESDFLRMKVRISPTLGHRQETQEYLDLVRQTSLGAGRDAERRSPMAQIRERLTGYRNHADAQSVG